MNNRAFSLMILPSVIATLFLMSTTEAWPERAHRLKRPPVIPLLAAAANNNIQAVNRHISQNSDINVVDQNGNTPLMLAAQAQHEAIVQRLVDVGANLIAKNNKGEEALLIAARTGNEKIVNTIVQAITAKNPEKVKDGSVESARQEFLRIKTQPIMSIVTKSLAAAASVVTLSGFAALIWYHKAKAGLMKDHLA